MECTWSNQQQFFGKIGMKEADTTALFSNVEHLSYILLHVSHAFLFDRLEILAKDFLEISK